MAAPPLDIKGKTYPMTTMSAVPRSRRWILSLLIRIFSLPYFTLQFARNLMFIHFACWQPIHRNRFPRLSEDQPQEELKYDYFLFTTNFNGSWDQYIDAFGLIRKVRAGLNVIWFTSKGFPGAWPIRPFKRYIHYYEYEMNYYYNAYPGMSVRDVVSATTLAEGLDTFVRQTKETATAGTFFDKYHSFLTGAAAHLADTQHDADEVSSEDEDQVRPRNRFPHHAHARPRGLQP